MAESLCCPPETITTLLMGYTLVQNKKFLKIKKLSKQSYPQVQNFKKKWVLNSMTDVFIRKRRGRFLRQKEDTGRCRQRCKLWCHKSRTARGQQRLEEARKNLLLDLWRVCSPVYSLIWTFNLQNDKRINYCCLSHWVYDYFLRQSQENNTFMIPQDL